MIQFANNAVIYDDNFAGHDGKNHRICAKYCQSRVGRGKAIEAVSSSFRPSDIMLDENFLSGKKV